MTKVTKKYINKINFVWLKKVTAILFLSVIMLATMHVSEFFKLNTFIKHYTEHKTIDPGLGLTEFIIIHYMTDVQDGDYHEDMKLPFKDLANHCYTGITFDQPATAINIKPHTQTITNKFRLHNLSIPANNFTHNIWQPPRA